MKVRKAAEELGQNMEDGWNSRGRSWGGGFTRSVEVWIFAVSFLLQYSKSQKLKAGDPEVFQAAKEELARTLTTKILTLGPTFIKLGQLLSTRIDVLPKEYIKEVRSLLSVLLYYHWNNKSAYEIARHI